MSQVGRLFLSFFLCVTVAQMQECGKVINENLQRIQVQGPPGKRGPPAEVDYQEMTRIVRSVVKEEMTTLRNFMTDEIAKLRQERRETNSMIELRFQRINEDNKGIKALLDSGCSQSSVGHSPQSTSKTSSAPNPLIKPGSHGIAHYIKENVTKTLKLTDNLDTLLDRLEADSKLTGDQTYRMAQILFILELSSKTSAEVQQMAVSYRSKKKYITSISLHYLSGVMAHSVGNMGVKLKRNRVESIRLVSKKMTESKAYMAIYGKTAKNYTIPPMEDLLHRMRQIEHTNHETTTHNQALCLMDIAMSYSYFQDTENNLQKNIEAINLMRQELPVDANQYSVVRICLVNAAKASEKLGKYEEAIKYYREAIVTYETDSELGKKRKNELIEAAESNIENIESKME